MRIIRSYSHFCLFYFIFFLYVCNKVNLNNMCENKEIIIKGKVRHIKYHNPQNGYTIMEVSDLKTGKRINVIANLLTPPKNMKLKITGTFSYNSKYGEQFNAISCEEILPDDIHGIEGYLGGGLFKGVGPATAKKIVSHFGKETLTIIDKSPERLGEIKGVGKKVINSLMAAWIRNKELKDVMVFLKKYDISNNLAMKIYKKYGSNTIQFVSEHPYRLITDIDGIGFLTCDKIALSMGIPYNSTDRICATINYIMEYFAQDGNTYQLPENIIKTTLEYLNNSNVEQTCFVLDKEVESCMNIMFGKMQLF